MSGAAFNRGGSKQNYATPPEFMDAVANRFRPISFDLAADHGNKKHVNYFSIEQDSLAQNWHEIAGVLWLNPPFDNIASWAEKCAAECANGATIFFLTPASVGSNWFRDHVNRKAMVWALNGRIAFDPENPKWGYPKDCMLSIYSMGNWGFDSWTWKNHA